MKNSTYAKLTFVIIMLTMSFQVFATLESQCHKVLSRNGFSHSQAYKMCNEDPSFGICVANKMNGGNSGYQARKNCKNFSLVKEFCVEILNRTGLSTSNKKYICEEHPKQATCVNDLLNEGYNRSEVWDICDL